MVEWSSFVCKGDQMFNRFQNILAIKRPPCFPGSSSITKKWLIAAAVLWIYIFLPCLGESATLKESALSPKIFHSLVLFGIAFQEDVIDNLFDSETMALIDGSLNTIKYIRKVIGDFISFICFVFRAQQSDGSDDGKKGNNNTDRGYDVFMEYIVQFNPLITTGIIIGSIRISQKGF